MIYRWKTEFNPQLVLTLAVTYALQLAYIIPNVIIIAKRLNPYATLDILRPCGTVRPRFAGS